MQPDYPLARAVAAASSAFRRGSPGRKVTKIVLHITDGHAHAENTAEMFATPGQRASAHFVIGQDGLVIQCVPLDDIAYHAHTANSYTVGIEHCARSPRQLSHDDPGLPLSEEQIEASVQLVTWLSDRYGLPRDRAHIQGHKEADPATDHDDCCFGVAGGFPIEQWCDPAAAVCA